MKSKNIDLLKKAWELNVQNPKYSSSMLGEYEFVIDKAMDLARIEERKLLEQELKDAREKAEYYRRNINRSVEDCLIEIERHKDHIKVLKESTPHLRVSVSEEEIISFILSLGDFHNGFINDVSHLKEKTIFSIYKQRSDGSKHGQNFSVVTLLKLFSQHISLPQVSQISKSKMAEIIENRTRTEYGKYKDSSHVDFIKTSALKAAEEISRLERQPALSAREAITNYFEWHKKQGYISHKENDIEEFVSANYANPLNK